jgi:hypothetical protein
MNNEIHPALDEFDAAMKTPRQRLAALAAENAELRAQLAEARKQPVALLPEITQDILEEWYDLDVEGATEWAEWNAVLARHFREAAEARVKPTMDVEAVAHSVWRVLYGDADARSGLVNSIADAIRKYLTDAPKPTLTVEDFSGGITITANSMQFGPDETLAAAVARAERAEHMASVMEGLADAYKQELKRVQADTRRECAAMAMNWNPCNETRRMLADRMERGE